MLGVYEKAPCGASPIGWMEVMYGVRPSPRAPSGFHCTALARLLTRAAPIDLPASTAAAGATAATAITTAAATAATAASAAVAAAAAAAATTAVAAAATAAATTVAAAAAIAAAAATATRAPATIAAAATTAAGTGLVLEAIATVNGTVATGFEGNLGFIAARRAVHSEQRSVGARATHTTTATFGPTAGTTAVGAAAGFIREPLGRMEFLFTRRKGEPCSTIGTGKCFVGERHSTTS